MYFSGKFDWLYTASLILAMSISLISQYYFGIVNQTLLEADQKNYIPIILQIGNINIKYTMWCCINDEI